MQNGRESQLGRRRHAVSKANAQLPPYQHPWKLSREAPDLHCSSILRMNHSLYALVHRMMCDEGDCWICRSHLILSVFRLFDLCHVVLSVLFRQEGSSFSMVPVHRHEAMRS